jgi:hypothetical protein
MGTAAQILTLAALLVPALGAQEAAILGALAEAERAAADRRAEDAVLAVRSAAERLPRVADLRVREELARSVDALRAKVDPLAAMQDEACRAAAAHLVELAGRYAEAGWLRTAVELLGRAGQLAPELARAPLEALRARLEPAAVERSAADALQRWFAGGEAVEGPDGWVRTDELLRGPPLDADGPPAAFVSGRRAAPDALRIAALVRAEVDGGFGFLFAYRHHLDFHALDVTMGGGDLGVQIVHVQSGVSRVLAERWVPRSAAEPKPVPGAAPEPGPRPMQVELRVADGKIVARFGDQQIEARPAAELTRGFVGLRAWRRGKDGFRPEFRQLLVEAEEAR